MLCQNLILGLAMPRTAEFVVEQQTTAVMFCLDKALVGRPTRIIAIPRVANAKKFIAQVNILRANSLASITGRRVTIRQARSLSALLPC